MYSISGGKCLYRFPHHLNVSIKSIWSLGVNLAVYKVFGRTYTLLQLSIVTGIRPMGLSISVSSQFPLSSVILLKLFRKLTEYTHYSYLIAQLYSIWRWHATRQGYATLGDFRYLNKLLWKMDSRGFKTNVWVQRIICDAPRAPRALG